MEELSIGDVEDSATLLAMDLQGAKRTAVRMVRSAEAGTGLHAEAHYLLGMCLHEEGDAAGAERVLYRAAAMGRAAGNTRIAERARGARLAIRALHGGPGVSGGTGASPSGRSRAAITALLRTAVAQAHAGWFEGAIARFDTALALVTPEADDHLLPALLSNRGLAAAHAGKVSAARDDLQAALALSEERSLSHLKASVLQNLGCLEAWRGETAQALEHFRTAEPHLSGAHRVAIAVDRADAFLGAGLAEEAGRCLDELAASTGARTAPVGDLVAKLLVTAKHRLSVGEPAAARALARKALRAVPRGSLWERSAMVVEWSARCEIPATRSRSRSRPACDRTGSAGSAEETTLRVSARCVPYTPIGSLPHESTPDHRARALRMLEDDHHEAALRILRSGAVSSKVPHLESVEHAFPRERRIAAAGLEKALESGAAAAAFEWAEYKGRPHLPDDRAAPCRHHAWAEIVGRFRAASAGIRNGDVLGAVEVDRLARRALSAQWHRCGHSSGTASRPSGGTVGAHGDGGALDAIAPQLGGRALLTYVQEGDRYAALTVVDGHARLHWLEPSRAEIHAAIAKLRFLAHERTFMQDRGRNEGAERQGRSSRTVDRHLIDPVARTIGDRSLIICPGPLAYDLPWGLLPSLAGRELCIAPSGRLWAERDRQRIGSGRVLLACGPDLQGADVEVAALRTLYPDADTLVGSRATSSAVLRLLPETSIAHLAGHGSVPSATPMLAAIDMADCPLLAYDIELLPSAPSLTVLSSCWVGRSVPAPSGAPLGLSAALVARGGRTVVAGTLPAPDGLIVEPMVRFHDAVAAGAGVAQAVADHLAEHGFLCIGAG